MFTDDQIRSLPGAAVYDVAGFKVGAVSQVWADTAGQPSWVSINTDPSGQRESFIPLLGASFLDGFLRIPYGKALVDDAPDIDVNTERPWDSGGLRDLYAHYALTLGEEAGEGTGRSGNDAMTRSEERLTVGMEQQPAGKARLRKYVVTEYVTTSVPVRHEEVRLERVPLDESEGGRTDIEAQGDREFGESEHEMILYAERPVMTTETVPVERVRLGKQTVTEQQTVSGEVRKERIDVELPEQDGTTI